MPLLTFSLKFNVKKAFFKNFFLYLRRKLFLNLGGGGGGGGEGWVGSGAKDFPITLKFTNQMTCFSQSGAIRPDYPFQGRI